jgi:anti-sigma B factor antagonist
MWCVEADERLPPQLELEESAAGPDIRLLRLRGELDVSTVPGFRRALQSAIDDGIEGIVVDLVDVTFIDSTGLMTLLNALRRIVRRNGHLVLACANPTVLRLFEVTRSDTTFEIVATREQALARVGA